MAELDGKAALVTGAGAGIGKAAALLMAKAGAKVAALDLLADRAEQTAEEIRRSGGEALALSADVSDAGLLAPAIRQAGERWGTLHVVFANAGINGVWAPLEDLSPEDFDRTIAVNLRGAFLTIKYALPYLARSAPGGSGGASIIVTGSLNGTRVFSNAGATAYAVSKAGQVALVKMLAVELGPQGIRVNALLPGWTETRIGENTRILRPVPHPAVKTKAQHLAISGGQAALPEQIAPAVVFLASSASARVTGTELWVDAGESLLG